MAVASTSQGGPPSVEKVLHSLVSWVIYVVAAIGSKIALLYPRQMKPTSGKKLHPTAYLDALRGYAAIPVAISHLHEGAVPPGLKIVFAGPAMVDTFFIISGFALSYSALGYIHRNQPDRFLDSLASSTFRRYFRLFLPTTFATFLAMLTFATGLGRHGGGGPNAAQPTFWGNVRFWVDDTIRNIDPFVFISTSWMGGGSHGSQYLIQLWTIPVEFKASMIVFLFLAAVCKMKPWARSTTIMVAIVFSTYWKAAYAGLFLFGMWLADRRHWRERASSSPPALPLTTLDVQNAMGSKRGVLLPPETSPHPSQHAATLLEKETIQDEPLLPAGNPGAKTSQPDTSSSSPQEGILRQIPHIALFAFGIYLLGGPQYCKADSPFPFNWLAAFVPPTYDAAALEHWHLVISAMLVCFALENSSILRAPFLIPFSQWLGELSFGIYIMHINVRYLIWDKYFLPWQTLAFGPERLLLFRWWLPSFFVMSILVAWAAEWFRRVDGKCVAFSRKLSGWLFVDK